MYLAWSPAPNPRVPCDSKGYTHTHPSPNGTVPKHLPSQERYRGARSSQEKAGFFGLPRRMGKLSNELPGLYETVAPEALKRILEEKNPEFAGTWASAPCKKRRIPVDDRSALSHQSNLCPNGVLRRANDRKGTTLDTLLAALFQPEKMETWISWQL